MKKKYIVISIICVLAAGICTAIGIYQYMQQQRAGEEYQEIREEVKNDEPAEEPESEAKKDPVVIPIDFASLQARNPDVYAWITVRAQTSIIRSCKATGTTAIIWITPWMENQARRDRSLRRNITAKILKTLIP